MKRILALLMAVTLACFAGCAGEQSESGGKSESAELPTGVSAPGTLKTDDLLAMVNKLLENEENTDGFRIAKEDGDTFEVPVSEGKKQTLYLFQIEDLEIAIFADTENDCVEGAYVRSLFDDSMVKAYMASFAGAFLSILEPQEYERMLFDVLPADGGEASAAGGETVTASKTSSGEAWSIYYNDEIVNILPADVQ